MEIKVESGCPRHCRSLSGDRMDPRYLPETASCVEVTEHREPTAETGKQLAREDFPET